MSQTQIATGLGWVITSVGRLVAELLVAALGGDLAKSIAIMMRDNILPH
jgi:hypothetical protein